MSSRRSVRPADLAPGCHVGLRRVYDADDSGYRVLVDRLWPRGLTKADAALDEWLKDAAPSTELRRWYGHDVERFEEFARRYRAELRQSTGIGRRGPSRRARPHEQPITLLTATRDVEHSGAESQELLHDRSLRAPLAARTRIVTEPRAPVERPR